MPPASPRQAPLNHDEGALSLAAPAKLNLYLHVTGRRDDGFHLLDSLIVFAGLGDDLTFLPSDELRLEIAGPFARDLAPQGPDEPPNLVMRAADALMAEAGVTDKGALVRLVKHLPVASGMGGGSADAAAALTGLSSLWGLRVPRARLMEIALDLGADVPICLHGRPSFIGGIGEDIAPAPKLPETWCVLVNPLKPVSTPEVFKARTGDFQAPARFDEEPADAARLATLLAARTNGLEDAAERVEPAIGEVLDAIRGTEGVLLTRMSGSGATCFGLYADGETAGKAAIALMQGGRRWWVKPAPILG